MGLSWLKQPLTRNLLFYLLAFGLAILLRPVSQAYLNTVFANALASYGVARGLNALISIMQESSVSAGFVVEGTIALGQVLDPINDLLERFSSLLLLSLASVGVQTFLLSFGFPLSIAVALLAFVIGLVAKLSNQAKLSDLMNRGVLAAMFLLLFIPLTGLFGSLPIGLNQQYENAQQVFQETRQSLEAQYGGVDGDRRWYERLDLRQIMNDMRTQTDTIIAKVIDLIVVFIVQTLLLPLLTLFVLWQLLLRSHKFFFDRT